MRHRAVLSRLQTRARARSRHHAPADEKFRSDASRSTREKRRPAPRGDVREPAYDHLRRHERHGRVRYRAPRVLRAHADAVEPRGLSSSPFTSRALARRRREGFTRARAARVVLVAVRARGDITSVEKDADVAEPQRHEARADRGR